MFLLDTAAVDRCTGKPPILSYNEQQRTPSLALCLQWYNGLTNAADRCPFVLTLRYVLTGHRSRGQMHRETTDTQLQPTTDNAISSTLSAVV